MLELLVRQLGGRSWEIILKWLKKFQQRAVNERVTGVLCGVLCVLTETDWLPVDFVRGRTTLFLKKDDARTVLDFRPITLTNHLLRCFHKALAIARWLGEYSPMEDYQLANKEWDGCGRGILLLDSIIYFAKAFDSVSLQSIVYVLRKRLVLEGIVSYIQKVYLKATTSVECGRVTKINSGILQGYPFSGCLFNMVLEEVIKECSSHLGGVSAFGSTFSVLAYADDTVLLADLLPQLELAVNLFGVTAKGTPSVPLLRLSCASTLDFLSGNKGEAKICDKVLRTWLRKYFRLRQWTPECFLEAKVKNGGMGSCSFVQRAAEQKYRIRLSLGMNNRGLLKHVLEVDTRNTTSSLVKPSTPLSERKQRLHGAKRRSKYNVTKGLHLAHKGCLTRRFLTETELNLPNSVLRMALQVQSGALETEVWKAVVHKRGGLSICRTCGSAPPTLRHVLQV
ncbi:unnamed protein product [Lepeophtheirus salmonis]|uniref:(salmon louse) hypothetical protein n=1 Tax=Lepeophtheirus salmonis TaxID=72036 RepID=A0A817FCW8_LEPSM|nr:unnamed protein product [Lepeophtheirus salmonis]